ncbi:uncharacterized protein LOC128957773 [Oppia nitens]|uniref:uncharacterized protein LOC128957773 n=1 Tax=Oppia nitens TaxID=1686743 RepID=UPI0023DAF934|nr:uncharacterized protein LOC128957773 [Oppia nitens]
MGKRSASYAFNGGRGGGGRGGGGIHWGPDRTQRFHTSFTSEESTSDSEQEMDQKTQKRMRKMFKKQHKRWLKWGRFGGHHQWPGFHGHMGSHHWPGFPGHHTVGPSGGQHLTTCILCWHRIKPLTDTEVLDCGHIYHRLCLKELFELAIRSSDTPLQVFCTHCKDKINDNLINEFRIRLGVTGVPAAGEDSSNNGQPSTSYQQQHHQTNNSNNQGMSDLGSTTQCMVVDIVNSP